jgi:hypothetical protein
MLRRARLVTTACLLWTTPSFAAPTVFKTLLVIMKNTAIPPMSSPGIVDFPGANSTLSDQRIAWIKQQYEVNFKNWIWEVSEHTVQLDTEVQISERPVSTGFQLKANGEWLGVGTTVPHPGVRMTFDSFEPEISAATARPSKYDSVFIWMDIFDESTNRYYNNGIAWSEHRPIQWGPTGVTIINGTARDPNFSRLQVFLHEWGHQLESVYAKFPDVHVPQCKDAQGNKMFPMHCYLDPNFKAVPDEQHPPGLQGWIQWLTQFYQGTIQDPNQHIQTGLGPKAWAHGTLLNPNTVSH